MSIIEGGIKVANDNHSFDKVRRAKLYARKGISLQHLRRFKEAEEFLELSLEHVDDQKIKE